MTDDAHRRRAERGDEHEPEQDHRHAKHDVGGAHQDLVDPAVAERGERTPRRRRRLIAITVAAKATIIDVRPP